jgi:hypothetical protein
MRILTSDIAVLLGVLSWAATAAVQYKPTDVPVEYSATVQAVGELGAAAASVKVHIDRFTPERDRKALVAALKTGDDTFLPALRKAPVVGFIEVKDQKGELRWAHQEVRDLGQVVTVATAAPVFFAGGGRADARPRAGYDMAIIRLDLDTIGMGKGTFASAARVKPNADATGVEVDDYGGTPLPITTVTRLLR